MMRRGPRPALRAAALLLAALAGGCDLGPDYKRPEIAQPAAWREMQGAAAWPTVDWWNGFGSPPLDRLMVEAAAANFDLAAAVAAVRQADAQVRISGAALLPAASLSGSAGRQRELLTGGSTIAFNDFLIEPSISYEVDFWGKNQAALESAKASDLAARYAKEVVALTVESSVATTYFTILALEEEIRVQQQNLATAQDALTGIVAQQKGGTATQLDVVQQQTVVAEQRAAIPPLEQQLAQNLDALAILLGSAPEDVPLPQAPFDAITAPPVMPGLPAELLQRRPDVSEAEAQLVAANANIKVARANFFPDVTLTAAGGVESTTLGSLFSPASKVYSVAGELTQPIFEGGLLEGELQLSKAQFEQLVYDYRKAVVSAFSDVENALVATTKTAAQLREQEDTVAKARQAYEISLAQYRGGTVTLLNVLTAENALFPAETTLVQDRLAHLEAVVSLFQALGGGWVDQARKSPTDLHQADADERAAIPAGSPHP
jgi:outer membrane protein, multidrug efflux system